MGGYGGYGGDCEWISYENEEFFSFDCGHEEFILTCTDFFIGPLVGKRISVTFATPQPAGTVTVCFGDGTELIGYLYPADDTGAQLLAVQTEEFIQCSMRGSFKSINCTFSSSYPCRSWHDQAFAMCPSDPNRGILVLGASCPTDNNHDMILVKDFDEDGVAEEILTCGEVCLPNIC